MNKMIELSEYDRWEAKNSLFDLLDRLESETACVVYNGWSRYRDPKGIRQEIDLRLMKLLGFTDE